MSSIFADTSGWACLVDPTQQFHTVAANIYRAARNQGRMIVTTDYILAELAALLTRPLGFPRPKLVTVLDGIK